MKKTYIMCAAALSMALAVAGTSCSSDKGADKGAVKTEVAGKGSKTTLPNYRYVDLDTVLSKYALAKDYDESMLRLQTNFQEQGRAHEQKIAAKGNSIQQKYQNNGYSSRDDMKRDEQALAQMQTNAQQTLGGLQREMEKQAVEAQRVINDSIQNFIKEYNKKHGYDAIFFKAATLYINPDLDITAEVVEGLNARYNKIKK